MRPGVDYPPTSSAEVKERVELYQYSSSGPPWPVLGRTLSLSLPNFRLLESQNRGARKTHDEILKDSMTHKI